MGRKVTFELSAIADAVKKAAAVAPTTGISADKSAGILITVLPGETATIKATDTFVYYTQWIGIKEAPSELCQWRVHSGMLSKFLLGLPMRGKDVTFEEIPSGARTVLKLTSGRATLKMFLMDVSDYPQWSRFDLDLLTAEGELGPRINSVKWAAHKGAKGSDAGVLTGIHLDGEYAIATDRYVMSASKLELPGFEEGITIPPGTMASVNKQGDVKVGLWDGKLVVAPDDWTQIVSVLYGEAYMPARRLIERSRKYPVNLSLKKSAMMELIGQATSVADMVRNLKLNLYIGKGEFAVSADMRDMGLFGNVIEIGDQYTDNRVIFSVFAESITGAISNCPTDDFTFSFDPDNKKTFFYIKSSSGYEAWFKPAIDTGDDK